MADQKAVQLDDLGNKGHGHSHGHDDHDHEHGHLLDVLDKPETFFTRNPRAPKLFLIVNIILLALTAQVFQKHVFVLPEIATPPPCNDAECVAADARCVNPVGYCANNHCMYTPIKDGDECVTGNPAFACWNGECLSVSDSCYAKACASPIDPQCVAFPTGTCSNGQCSYDLLPDGSRCYAPGAPRLEGNATAGENVTAASNVYEGYMCQQGVCTSPTRVSLANFAYTASIQAGIIGSALALEIILSGDFTPDLAAFAINAGLILIGFDGRLQDLGLEVDTGLGRTQISFGFIAGGLAVLFGGALLKSKRRHDPANKLHVGVSIILVLVWLVAFGQVCNVIAETFEHFDEGVIDTGANMVYPWAYPATIFAASVNIALAHSILATGTYTPGFAFFAAISAGVALAWASKHVEKDVYGPGSVDNDFSGSVSAWQSWAVIAGAISLVLGLVLGVTHKPAKPADAPASKFNRLFALAIVGCFWTLMGIVSNNFDVSYFDRDEAMFGNNMRDFRSKSNYANLISPFAWDFSIWTAVVASSFGLELLFRGHVTTGIAALTMTQAANLVGWAAKHQNEGSPNPNEDDLEPDVRAWTALALVSGVLTFIVCHLIFFGKEKGEQSAVVHVHAPHAQPEPVRTLNPEDRDLFATEGGAARHNDH